MIETSAIPIKNPAAGLFPGLAGNPGEPATDGAIPPEFATLLAASLQPKANPARQAIALPGAADLRDGGKLAGKDGGNILPLDLPESDTTEPDPSSDQLPAEPTAQAAAFALTINTLSLPAPASSSAASHPAAPHRATTAPIRTASDAALQPASQQAPAMTTQPAIAAAAVAAAGAPIAAQLALPGRKITLPTDAPAEAANAPSLPSTPATAALVASSPTDATAPLNTPETGAAPGASLALTPSAPAQSQLSASAPASPAAATPHDFATLVDRLVEARDTALAGTLPQTVHSTVRHAEFGQVSLRFETGGQALSVALSSPDPDFARAVAAAAPAAQAQSQSQSQGHNGSGAEGYGSASRHDTAGQQGSASAFSGQQQRGGGAQPANAAELRANPASPARDGQRTRGERGIFA